RRRSAAGAPCFARWGPKGRRQSLTALVASYSLLWVLAQAGLPAVTLLFRGSHARKTTRSPARLWRRGAGAGGLAADPLAALAGAGGSRPAHDLPAGRRPGGLLRRLPARTAGHPALRRGGRLLPVALPHRPVYLARPGRRRVLS